MLGSSNSHNTMKGHEMGVYVEPKRGIHLQDTTFYHLLDVPRLQQKKWLWDLRGDEAAYLGKYNFTGKRVLEFGPASGGLTFWMERQGAEIVAVDLSPDIDKTSWDLLILPEDDIAQMKAAQSEGIRRLNNGFWYAHEQFGSKAKLVHATAYHVPTEIGRFDVVTLCSVLEHLRDPFGALENVLNFTDNAIIITNLAPLFISKDLQKLPLAYFMPDKARRHPHGGWTWWHFSPEVYVRYLDLKGFKIISNTTRPYKHVAGPREVFTIVTERGVLPAHN